MISQVKRLLRKRGRPASRPFDLQRTFAVLGLICIAAVSTGAAIVVTRFLTSQLLKEDAEASADVLQAVADTEELGLPLVSPNAADNPHSVPEFFRHIASMPDVFRVIVYNPSGTIVWSSDPRVIGRQFADNDDLSRAISGELVFEISDRAEKSKSEYAFIRNDLTKFIENYIPVRDRNHEELLGIVEIYKFPNAISASIAAANRLIWSTAAAGSIFLYLTLFWIVRRAAIALQAQHERLTEAETMAAVGEVTSGIAHDIRNPLASIRTSAELALEELSEEHGPGLESVRDVITEVDRLERNIRELMLMARGEREELRTLCVAEMAKCCADTLEPAIKRQGIKVSMDTEEPLSPVVGDRGVLHLAVNNVISNALDAMPNGGALDIRTRMVNGGDDVELTIADSGQGIPDDRVDKVFKPFHTSKNTGLGLGLALTRQIIERHGGTIALASQLGKGTTVTIRLPAGSED